MEQRYTKIRKQLDDFGYQLPLVPDAVPLVEKLVADLVQTTESLRRYMQIAKEVIEERDKLQLGAEPYKCDNAKLVKECNDLHLAFLQFKEKHENLQKEHKRKLSLLEKDKRELHIESQKLRTHLSELESKLRGCRCPKVISNRLQSKSSTFSSNSKFLTKTVSKSKSAADLDFTMVQAQEKINELKNEIKKLQNEQMVMLENNEVLKNQITTRDREISRLNEMLEGGRSREAVNQDCCYKNVDVLSNKMQEEINNLRRSNKELEDKLRDAVSKQHEAMKRALHLAERNKQLEREMLDIDQMALAVEAECNSTVKSNAAKVSRLQAQTQEMTVQIQSLERETAELKREKQNLFSDIEAMKLEKKHLQSILETALEEKKRMNDKINRFTIIENDLNTEIDRLVQLTGEQKYAITELECRLLYGNETQMPMRTQKKSSPLRRRKKSKSPTSPKSRKPINLSPVRATVKPKRKFKKKLIRNSRSPSPLTDTDRSVNAPRNSPRLLPSRNRMMSDFDENVCCNPGYCSIHNSRQTTQRLPPIVPPSNQPQVCPCCSCRLTGTSKGTFDTAIQKPINAEEVPRQQSCSQSTCPKAAPISTQRQSEINLAMEHIMAEKDYYMKEYHRLLEDHKSASIQTEISILRKQLLENEQMIRTLQHENKSLAQDKHNLMTRLETARDQTDFDAFNLTLKSSVKRLERENELLKDDISKLEEDRDALRRKLKMMHESQFSEKGRYEQQLKDAEDNLRKLEMECRELLQNRGVKHSSMKNLEEEVQDLHTQLRQCQTDLNQQRALYSQLKTLHEQTDKSLAESQNQVHELERDLEKQRDANIDTEKERQMLENELKNIKGDMLHIKGSMGKIDSEKDSLLLALDEKTEKIANVEVELRAREKIIKKLEEENNDLLRKVNSTLQDTSSREHMFRSMQAELNSIKDELDAANRAKDLSMQENRRLQEELLACTVDCKKAHSDLDIARRQVEDLKRQLQTYVAEVKRTEDLISHKEIERSEMLDQFRSLSQEAMTLENNNHTLEHEATQSRVQLSLALDHANELDRRLEGQEVLIRSYERQIADLTSQVASLEVQLKSKDKILEKVEVELKSTKDLCVKLDEQKDNLYKQLNEKQHFAVQVDRDRDRLRREGESLQTNWNQDRQAVDSLERLLRECRQENVEQNLLNQELQTELNRMKTRIEDLQHKFVSATEQLDAFQEKALDYAHQNKQLRREIANERNTDGNKDKARSESVISQPTPASQTKPRSKSLTNKQTNVSSSSGSTKNAADVLNSTKNPSISVPVTMYCFERRENNAQESFTSVKSKSSSMQTNTSNASEEAVFNTNSHASMRSTTSLLLNGFENQNDANEKNRQSLQELAENRADKQATKTDQRNNQIWENKNSKEKFNDACTSTEQIGTNICCCLHCCPHLFRNPIIAPNCNCNCVCHFPRRSQSNFSHVRAIYSFTRSLNLTKSTNTSP